MNTYRLRSLLYKGARILGDYHAVRADLTKGTWRDARKSKIVRRVARRVTGRWVGLNIFRRIFG